MTERKDTGHVTYRGEDTMGGVTNDCWTDRDCDQHYVVRLDGTWVRGFHNEADARTFANEMTDLITNYLGATP